MKVLVVAAHPDDWELGMAGTIERLKKEGNEVDIVILGKGRGDSRDNRFDSLPLMYWVELVEDSIQIAPDIIFTHYEKDLNIDHQIIYKAVITATRPQPDCCVKEIYSFEVPSSTEWAFPTSFSPDVFYSITGKDMIRKWELLSEKYENEMRKWPHPRSYSGVEILAKYRGMQCGCEYAEAFKTVRRIL